MASTWSGVAESTYSWETRLRGETLTDGPVGEESLLLSILCRVIFMTADSSHEAVRWCCVARLSTPVPLLLLRAKLCASLLACGLLELCGPRRTWRSSPVGRCRDCACDCHLAAVPIQRAGTPTALINRWCVVKALGDRSQTSSALPRGEGHQHAARTCDFLLWTATGGCMCVCRWTASLTSVDIMLIDCEVRRVNAMLLSRCGVDKVTLHTSHWKTQQYPNAIQVETWKQSVNEPTHRAKVEWEDFFPSNSISFPCFPFRSPFKWALCRFREEIHNMNKVIIQTQIYLCFP